MFRLPPFSSVSLAALALVGAACGADRAADNGRVDAVPTGGAATAGGIGAALQGVTRGAVPEHDLGPDVRVDLRGDSVMLTIVGSPGDQINALQPPVLELADGVRHVFAGHGITPDSAYFVGEVSLALPRSVLPLTATLQTSYCRVGERLCRSASRPVRVARTLQ